MYFIFTTFSIFLFCHNLHTLWGKIYQPEILYLYILNFWLYFTLDSIVFTLLYFRLCFILYLKYIIHCILYNIFYTVIYTLVYTLLYNVLYTVSVLYNILLYNVLTMYFTMYLVSYRKAIKRCSALHCLIGFEKAHIVSEDKRTLRYS